MMMRSAMLGGLLATVLATPAAALEVVYFHTTGATDSLDIFVPVPGDYRAELTTSTPVSGDLFASYYYFWRVYDRSTGDLVDANEDQENFYQHISGEFSSFTLDILGRSVYNYTEGDGFYDTGSVPDGTPLRYVEYGIWPELEYFVEAPSGLSFNYAITVYRTGPVPEPTAWSAMLLGFGVIGASLRRRRARNSEADRLRPAAASSGLY